jgi:hypothetical protein
MAIFKAKKLFTPKRILVILNILVLLGLAGFGGYFFKKYQDTKNASPEKIQQAQIDQTISEVGKLYALPANEKPDVATVKDKEALKKQYPFFDQAENDDVVLIYKEAKLAILYRPSTKKLVKVGPVNIENGLSIRTVGSETERAAVEKLLTDNKLTFTTGGAAKTAISGVIVVDVKGTNSEQAKKLAEIVKGTVASLPAGEDKPADADLLVLVGPTP